MNRLLHVFSTAPAERYTLLSIIKYTLLSIIKGIDNNLLDFTEPILLKTLLFGSNSFDTNINKKVVNAAIEYVLSTKTFETPMETDCHIFLINLENYISDIPGISNDIPDISNF